MQSSEISERAVLGSLLRLSTTGNCKELYGVMAAGVTEEHFATESLIPVWKSIAAVAQRNKGEYDPSLVASEMETMVGLREDSTRLVLDLLMSEATGAMVEEHARNLCLHYTRRRSLEIVNAFLHEAEENPAIDFTDEITNLEADLSTLREGTVASSGSVTLEEAVSGHIASLADKSSLNVVPAHLAELAEHLPNGGYTGGQLVILAGRPGMGKSAFALDVLRWATREGGRGLFYSLEMTADEIGERFIRYNEGSAKSTALARGHDVRIVDRVYRLSDIESGAINEMYRATSSGTRLRAIVVDHAQLVDSANPNDRSREREVARISGTMKRLAKRTGAAVFLLSQLNRQSEHREDRRPSLSDLRDSGALEQDADLVLALYRPSYYDRETKQVDEVIVLKSRQGRTGTVPALFDGVRSTWRSI